MTEKQENRPQREMPKYRCHKVVHALKIGIINWDDTSADFGMMTPADEHYAPFRVDCKFMAKNEPVAGGYYVVYADGYKSFSPAEAFEAGYTLDESVHQRVNKIGREPG